MNPLLTSIEQMPSILRYIRIGQKIEALKTFRLYYPCGLKEAKDAVEAIEAAIKFLPKPVAEPKYIVIDRATGDSLFDVSPCSDKDQAVALANDLLRDSSSVIIATIVSESQPVSTLVMKPV